MHTVRFHMDNSMSSHTDNDFFLSVTSVIEKEIETKCTTLKMDAPVCNYFCFPEHGVCIALRSGDALLFNPLVYHCISSRCNSKVDRFCLSMYLKTAIVGGNDNGEKAYGGTNDKTWAVNSTN